PGNLYYFRRADRKGGFTGTFHGGHVTPLGVGVVWLQEGFFVYLNSGMEITPLVKKANKLSQGIPKTNALSEEQKGHETQKKSGPPLARFIKRNGSTSARQ
ncbi:MAG: hypothetical protein KDD60_06855, partial [Bdellovibrionales bacterium]|nr:hypothetical protein [Bdellovibrionales bacterium]